jgi:MFS family permease
MNTPLPRAFWLLWGGSFVNRLGTFVIPFLALFLTGARGFTYAQAGATAALFGLGSMFAGPIGGALADRVGRRFTLVLGLALGALFLLAILSARTPIEIGIAVFLCGLGSDIFRPALFATVADLIPHEQRSRAYGLLYWSFNLGFAISMPLGGALAKSGYGKLFFADAGTNLLFAALILFGLKETRPTAPDAAAASSVEHQPSGGLREVLRDPTFLVFGFFMMLNCLVFMQSMSSLPLAMRAQGIDTETYGRLLAINGLLIVALQPFAERAVGWMRPSHRIALSIALAALGTGLQMFCTTPLHYALAISLWTLGEITLAGISPSVVARMSPPSQRGAYQGVYGAFWSAGALLAPLFGPELLALHGPRVLWGGSAVMALVAAVGMLLLGDRLERAQRI